MPSRSGKKPEPRSRWLFRSAFVGVRVSCDRYTAKWMRGADMFKDLALIPLTPAQVRMLNAKGIK